MRTNKIFAVLAMLPFFLAGCNGTEQNTQENEGMTVAGKNVKSVMDDDFEEYEFEIYAEDAPIYPEIIPLPTKVPRDIVNYFNLLEDNGLAAPVTRGLNDDEGSTIQKALHELQRYSSGKRKYYPVEDMKRALSYLSQYEHYMSGHSEDHHELRLVQNYRNHFVAIAAMLCPNLDFMAYVKDADETIGLIQYPDWSHTSTIQSYVFLPKGKTLTAKVIDELNGVQATKIFRLKDSAGSVYYLFSNDDNSNRFAQVLCMMNKGTLEHVASLPDIRFDGPSDAVIQFNPRKLEWNVCEWKNNNLHKIPGTRVVSLKLAGKKSRFNFTEIR